MSKKISAKRLKKLVYQLVSEHREFGLKNLNLAIWYGDQENTTHVHLFEVISGLPSSIEDDFEPIVYPPSKDFPIFLSAIVVAPSDVERAIEKKDSSLAKVTKDQPEVIFMDN